MLVLSRQPNQLIHIRPDAADIVIRVIDVCGNKVRLGIETTEGTRVMRSEILAINPHALETTPA